MTAEELRQRTRAFALNVIDLCTRLRSDDVSRLVKPQLLRSAAGVAANYRAACRSRSRREFISRLGIVVEEADESELWLDVVEARRLGPEDRVRELRSEAVELRAVMSRSRASARERVQRERRSSG